MAKKKMSPIHALLGIIILVAGLLLLTFVNTWIGIIVMIVGAVYAVVSTVMSKKRK